MMSVWFAYLNKHMYFCAIFLCLGGLLPVNVVAQPITVGQVGPFTGLPSPDAHEVHAGAKAYFDQVNKNGGIAGRRIEFFKLDDQFKGEEFIKQLELAAQRNPIALITPIGSAALQLAMKESVFGKYDFVVINAIPGTDMFRKPGHPRLFHIRASDGQQIATIFRHAKTVGINKIAVLHQNLPIGVAGLEVARSVATEQKVEITGVESKHDDASLVIGAQAVNRFSPSGTLVIGSPKFMADAIVQLRKVGQLGPVFALSYLPAGLVTKLAGETGARGVAIAQTFPNPLSRATPLVREFQKTMATFAPEVKNYSSFHLEGYVSAAMLVKALQRGGAVSAEALTRALRNLGPQDLGDFVVDFSKGNSGSTYIDIAVVGAGGKLLY
jgi:branched-chain amino acid transport system substrate-binding protein